MRLEFGYDTVWNCLRIILITCDWNLAITYFGNVIENFRRDAIAIFPRLNLEPSQNNFNEIRLDYGYVTIWKCVRMFSMRCDWSLARTQFGIVLEQFRRDAIGIWLRHNLELS